MIDFILSSFLADLHANNLIKCVAPETTSAPFYMCNIKNVNDMAVWNEEIEC